MGVYLSPGVYTVEIDVSQYPSSVSTAICGMVGTAVNGPVNTPTYITNPQQFLNTFGNPTPTSYLGYAALAYLEKGNQLYITRVGATVGSDALAKATKMVVGGTQSIETAATPGLYTLTGQDSFGIIVNGTGLQTIYWNSGGGSATDLATTINQQVNGLTLTASDIAGCLSLQSNAVGALSTLEISRIDNSDFSFPNITPAIITGTILENYVITNTNKYMSVKINGGVEVLVTLTIGTRTAAQVATDITNALSPYATAAGVGGVVVITSVESGSGTSLELQSTYAGIILSNTAYSTLGFFPISSGIGSVSGTSTIPAGVDNATQILRVDAIYEGTWASSADNDLQRVYFSIQNNSDTLTFNLNVYYGGMQVEGYQLLTRGAANVADANYIEKIVNVQSQYIRIVDQTSNAGAPHNVNPYTTAGLLAGGKNGILGISDGDYIGVAWNPATDAATGIQTFSDADKININILCTPGISSTAVITAMLALCTARADCMAIIDPPLGLTPQQVVDWHNGRGNGSTTSLNSSYGALYYDWLEIYDSYNKVNIYVPPSGFLAGVYALNDFVAEPWFAPAGLNRGRILSAIGTRYSPTLGERNLLYGDGNSINPIVNFVQDGITVWGQRTLQRTSTALDRVNVRRLMLYLRKVAANFSNFFVFEPNDPDTWRRVRYTFNSFLADVQSRRGITDYKVICDETINTPVVVDRNEMKVRILIRPTKAAEFIVLEFVIMPQGATLETEAIL